VVLRLRKSEYGGRDYRKPWSRKNEYNSTLAARHKRKKKWTGVTSTLFKPGRRRGRREKGVFRSDLVGARGGRNEAVALRDFIPITIGGKPPSPILRILNEKTDRGEERSTLTIISKGWKGYGLLK